MHSPLPHPSLEPEAFAARAAEVAALLRHLASAPRLMILCHLAEVGRATPGSLALRLGLSQSALSQHLARLRTDAIIAFDRDAQTLWYRIEDPRVVSLMGSLYALYCTPTERI